MTNETEKTDLRTVKALLKLLEEHKLDVLEVGNIKLVKSKHIIEQPKPQKTAQKTTNDQDISEEDMMFWSSSQ